MGPESLYCSKWRKILKWCRDLDLGLTMPNIELFRFIFIYYNAFKFHVPRVFFSFVQNHTPKHIHTHIYGHMHTNHKDSDEFSIVAFSKNATIMKLHGYVSC